MELKIKALSPKIGTEIPLPSYATAGSAGLDLRACIDAPVYLPGTDTGLPNSAMVPTGIAIQLPGSEYVALVYARSGLAVKHGVTLSNCVGVIDSDYRGQVHVGLHNLSGEPYTVQPGDRVAQLMVVPVAAPEIEVVDALPETVRGAGGLGSTGR